MKEILRLHLSEVSTLIKERRVSPVDIVSTMIEEIKAYQQHNPVFITVCEETAINEAKKAEADIMNGSDKGPLHGIPLSIKDNIAVANTRYTLGSGLHQNRVSEIDAPIVQRLRAAGAIVIGKTNLDEFANHVTGKNQAYGTIKNPVNMQYTAGGSSGGSAASVAANLSYGSLGTDTSGSIRIPASCCGIVGLKPTYQLLPDHGVAPLSWSLDHVGLLAKNCQDLSILFDSVAPGVKKDPVKLGEGIRLAEMTIGIPEHYFYDLIDKEVKSHVQDIIKDLAAHGATIKYVNVDEGKLQDAMVAQEVIIATEAAYYHESQLAEHGEHYEKDNQYFFRGGLDITKDAYRKALQDKQMIGREFEKVFANVDLLLTPTLPVPPTDLSDKKVMWETEEEDILTTFSRYTGPFNVSGFPALSVPIAKNEVGLPIGLQLVGGMYMENKLMRAGDEIMRMCLGDEK